MESEKLLDLVLGPQTVGHLCERSLHGRRAMEARRREAGREVGGSDRALEEFGSEKTGGGGVGVEWETGK